MTAGRDAASADKQAGGRDNRPPAKRLSTRRLRNKAITRAYLVAVAGAVFDLYPYEAATMRRIAAQARVSVGTMFVHFPDKAGLWRAAMGCEPPVDSRLSRSALSLFEALEALIATRTPEDEDPLWEEAEALVRVLEPAAIREIHAAGGARARPSRRGAATAGLAHE